MNTKTHILLRKLLHLGTLIPFSIYWVLVVQRYSIEGKMVLGVAIVGFLIYEYFRLERGMNIIFSGLIKPREAHSLVDGFNLLISGVAVHFLFDFKVAVAAILIGIIGDTVSTLGGLYGRIKVFPDTDIKTTWEGILITIAMNGILASTVLGFNLLSILMAISGALIETSVTKIDDNLAVPLGSACIGTIILWLIY